MLSVLLKFKKVLLGLLIAAISLNPITSNADTDVVIRNNDTSSVEIYIRSGEWSNEKEAKPGKRIYLDSDQYFKTRIRVRKDENGYFISEADINKEVASKLNEKLIEKGVKTKVALTDNAKDDLNSAGRKAKSSNPKIYLSIHHNYCQGANGYLFMYNNGDTISEKYAQRLSDSIADVTPVKQRNNHPNLRDGKSYIGELNEFKNTNTIAILAELGFFSDVNGDLISITNKNVINNITENMANEIVYILNEIS